ncbi:MAG: Fe(2+) transporter permease subunit FeoB [Gammaproteobacteria bacterium]
MSENGSRRTIALAGNPNCGKTTLFNALTGARQRVGNWPGVTVERKSGVYRHDGNEVEVVDLPGTYSLDEAGGNGSTDEAIARDYVLSGEADLVVNIVDGSHLERNLYLTSQLMEMRVPMLVVVNMLDKAEAEGLETRIDILADQLGCPVVGVVASRESGVTELKDAVARHGRKPEPPATAIAHDEAVETAIAHMRSVVALKPGLGHMDAAWVALKLLEGESLRHADGSPMVDQDTVDEAARLRDTVEMITGDEMDILIADARYGFVHEVVRLCQTRRGEVARNLTAQVDRFVLNRLLGIPVFLAVMYLMFMFTINIGGAFIDAFDGVAAALFVDGFKVLLDSIGAPEWLQVVLADGLGGGIQTVATFIPIVGFLFLFLSVLEDSGYMTRAAFVMDRLMRGVGLPGKSFVPLIVGFGCNVPAIMAARTLENERDRLLTVAMTPFMSCGARLPVYALFAAAFFPVGGQNVVFGLYLAGIAVAVLTGLILKYTLLQGPSAPFVMEMPTYHLPTLKGVGLRTYERTKTFVVKAGALIVPMVMVLAILNSTGTDGSFGNEDSDRSVLAEIGRELAPVFAPMGIKEDNWPATVGIFTGILAKEAVVGTLDSLYGALGTQAPADEEGNTGFDLGAALLDALATVPGNLADAIGSADDPLGVGIGDLSDSATAAAEQAVSTATFGAMAQRFDGTLGAFAYLLFILLYAPCTAAIAAIHRETGTRWTLFVVAWTTGLAYASATVVYQAGQLATHPLTASVWLAAITLALGTSVWGMNRRGRALADAGYATLDAGRDPAS